MMIDPTTANPVRDVLTPKLVWRYRAVPILFCRSSRSLTILVEDMFDLEMIDSLFHLLNLGDVQPVAISQEDLEFLMRKHFPEGEEEGAKARRRASTLHLECDRD